jgi:hypothetical protein
MVVELLPPLSGPLLPDIELLGSYVEIELEPMLGLGFGLFGDVTTLPCVGVLGPRV